MSNLVKGVRGREKMFTFKPKSWSQVLRHFTTDDFTGKLPKGQHRKNPTPTIFLLSMLIEILKTKKP